MYMYCIYMYMYIYAGLFRISYIVYVYFSPLLSQLGGVVKPNDGQCHMGSLRDDGTRQYEEWDTLVGSLFFHYFPFFL